MIVYKVCKKCEGKLVSLSVLYEKPVHELPRRFIRTYEVGRWTQSPRTIARRKVAPLFCFRTLQAAQSIGIFGRESGLVILKCVARGIRKHAVMADWIPYIPTFWETNTANASKAPHDTVLCESVFPIEVVGERE